LLQKEYGDESTFTSAKYSNVVAVDLVLLARRRLIVMEESMSIIDAIVTEEQPHVIKNTFGKKRWLSDSSLSVIL
jgi:hypothetical protein